MTVLIDADHVVSMDEIADYLEARGRWTGNRFELASTAAKRTAIRRAQIAHWAMRAGWMILAVVAVPPFCIAAAPMASILAGALPAYFPSWIQDLLAQHGHSTDRVAVPGISLLFAPVVLWSIALATRRLSGRLRIEYEESIDADRVEFVEPLIAGGLLGSPEALFCPSDEPEPFCVPVFAVPADLPDASIPDERHLIQAAAQCLLIENAYHTPIDVGMVRFRNRSVSFLMTDSARERTEEILVEIRQLLNPIAI